MLKQMLILSLMLTATPAFADLEDDVPTEVPAEVREKCLREVVKMAPLKVTYNWGTMKLDASKTDKEIKDSCQNDNVAGCFHYSYDYSYKVDKGSIRIKSMQMGEYTCFYPKGEIKLDFSGRIIDIVWNYSGCSSRAVLRHELQHFMIWKTGSEQMLIELQEKLLPESLAFCKNCAKYDQKPYTLDVFRRIYEKWRHIIEENQKKLDEIDHNHEEQVNYPVCFPLSVRTDSF